MGTDFSEIKRVKEEIFQSVSSVLLFVK